MLHGLTRPNMRFNKIPQHCALLIYKLLLNMHFTWASRAHHDHASQQISSLIHELNGLHGLTKKLLNMHVTRAPRAQNGLAIQPHTTMQCHTGSTQCNAMSHGLNSMQCHTRTGSTGSTSSPKSCWTCMFHGLHELKTHFDNIHRHITLYLP